MKTKYYFLIVAILLPASGVSPRELTLEEVLKMAESHSYQIKASLAQREAFQNGLRAATSERWPTLSVSGVASYRDEVAQFEVALPTGDVFRRDVGLKENYQADLRLNLPLFTGGRVGGGIDLARASSDYYGAVERATVDEVLLAARVAFMSLYRSDRLVEAARAGLKRARIIAGDVQSLYDAGAADSVSLLDARFALIEAESRLTNALSLRRQNEIRLLVLVGLDPTETITLLFRPAPPEVNDLVPSSVSESKPELAAAFSAVGMSRSLVKVSQAALWPSVSLFTGYSWGKPNLDQFHDEFNDYFTVGAVASWVFNLGGKPVRNIAKARSRLSAAQFEFEKTREQLDRNARIILENLKLAYENYQAASENHRVTSEHYRLATEKHREGALSANRLIEIEALLSQAEASLASTMAEFYVVQSQYYHAVGSDLLKEGM